MVSLRYRTPPSRLSTADVRQVLQSVVLRNPALSHRIEFSRGVAYQEWYPAECDFAELQVTGEDAVPGRVTEVIDECETSLDAAPMSARLIRYPEGDDLLLVFDHAFVDEQSLLLIRRQLNAPSSPDGRQLARYRAAINDRKTFEDAAANEPGVKFWANRLAAVGGKFPRAQEKTTRVVPAVTLPSVAIPRSFGGTLFPYVLFSLHRALRDVAECGPTVIGYPWDGRNGAYTDVVGCFMNTAVSLDTTGPQQASEATADFVNRWYEEIDYADVPFTAVAALDATFRGSVTAYLGYTHAVKSTVEIAGIPAVRIASSHGRTPPTCTFEAAATVHGDELQLRLILDEEVAGYGAQELGTRWSHWLNTAILSFPDWKP
ncbi:hypothetical protein ACIA2T_01230 [Amycolatopsis japonica]|uniref:hypothetical protein n=1 Tax=Amycolatopsis japonica TaxID=208439 RepID=UPI0037A1BDAD